MSVDDFERRVNELRSQLREEGGGTASPLLLRTNSGSSTGMRQTDVRTQALSNRMELVRQESLRRKEKLAALKKNRGFGNFPVSEVMSLTTFDEGEESGREEVKNKFAEQGIFVSHGDSPDKPPTTKKESGVLVSWLAFCHERGQSAYDTDLVGLMEFLAQGHGEFQWSHLKMSTIVDVVKGAIQRSHGFEGFVDEELLEEGLRVAKDIEAREEWEKTYGKDETAQDGHGDTNLATLLTARQALKTARAERRAKQGADTGGLAPG